MNDDRNIDPMLAELLTQHALQCLDPESAARLQRLMGEDPALAREATELSRVVELLPLAVHCPPPPHLRERVLAAAGTAASVQAHARKAKIATPRRWAMVASLTFAAAAALACAVLVSERATDNARWERKLASEEANWVRERQRYERQLEVKTRAASMLLEPNIVESFPMDAMNGAGAMGYVLLDLDARRASIAVLDLPAVATGYSYHLWAVLESKQVPCGRFTPAADGRILTQFPIPVDSYTSPIQKLILTVEPDTEQTAPRGTTVMSSPVGGAT